MSCAQSKCPWGQGCTHKNGDFGAISVTDRSCATPTFKVERDISEKFCVTLSCSVNGREDWNPLRRKWIFSCEDWDLEYQTLSANSANIAFVRDSKTECAVPPWNVTYPRNCWRKTPWLPILASWGITKVQITFKRQKKTDVNLVQIFISEIINPFNKWQISQ